MRFKPRNQKEKTLIKAFLKLKTDVDMIAFLRDLMTVKEIEEFANRLEMARLLKKGLSYKKIADKLGVSTTTVGRVAFWLNQGCEGYGKVFK